MNTHSCKRAIALLSVFAFLSTGCTSLQPVALNPSGTTVARPDVKSGESVVVTRKDGTRQTFTVLKVEDDALVGHNTRVPYTDMSSLEVKRADGSKGKTALIVGAVVLGVAGIAAASGGGGGGHGGY
jgi:hypothetical protein